MKIVKNFLPEEVFLECQTELRKKLRDRVWTSSSIAWSENVKKGIIGSTLMSKLSPELSEKISKELKPHLEESGIDDVKDIWCDFYVWQYYAGISAHNDQKYKFGATIYLNDEWFVTSGGLFIWYDKETETEKIHTPERNALVLNTDFEEHLVTPVTLETLDFRYTIQIWGR